MLNFKCLNIMALSFAFLTTCLMTSDLAAAHDKRLSLDDFIGKYSILSESVGGVDGTSGASSITIGQVHFDTLTGISVVGTVNFFNQTIYTGPIGDPLTTIQLPAIIPSPTGIIATITDVDFAHGIGNLRLFNPISQTNTDAIFIATLNEDGKVKKLLGHTTVTPVSASSPTGVSKIVLKRQHLKE
jgi:hypothetical protein